ncbi:hypothetical protein [Poriferisphaera sp. WC338]|uniref:hypothetical protein n=1 Tax=Poriferisphaera sp. WC338 TaxID=3425129 RepID=UPI003D81986A
MKHSKLGIASFSISITSILCLGFMFIAIIATVIIQDNNNLSFDLVEITIGVSIFIIFLLDLIALILGVVSLFLPQTGKIFAIIGICLSPFPALAILFMMIVGTFYSA